MRKREIFLIIIILIFTFILVYSPHFSYRFPIHIDEWYHIDQTIKLTQGDINFGLSGTEIGFHAFLALISLLSNLVLIYKFLPAIWAVLASIILFYTIKKKTSNFKEFSENESFFIALFAMIFFASIKSNINITGLWFFTPLTFSIPLIFLYIYLFSEGLEKNNKKYLIYSLIIMIFLLIVHAPSVLFAIPFLLVYSIINYKKVKENYKTLLIFLLIPIIGIVFYIFITLNPSSLLNIINILQFKRGWGVLELNNSPFELYSLAGYILAFIGILVLIISKEKRKYFLIFILWPLSVLILIIIFKLVGVSYFSPYQRNLYYLALSLPFLSSLGLFYILKLIKLKIKSKYIYKIIALIILILVIFLSFFSYFSIPENIRPYKAINEDDYKALKFLSTLNASSKNSKVISPILISDAIFPITQKETIGTVYFSGNRTDVDNFYNTNDCKTKEGIIKRDQVGYVLSKDQINCNWTLIYQNKDYIYRTD